VISGAKNSNKFQKNQVLEGKISSENVITLGPMAQATPLDLNLETLI
jgi:hypothetical protein